MINSLMHRHLAFRFILGNCCSYQQSQLYSALRLKTSALLKHSRFSEYMGLSEELRKLEKDEQKTERSEVRSNSFIIIVSLLGFFSAAVFMSSDSTIRLKSSILKKRFKLSFAKKEEQQRQALEEMVKQVQLFLKKHPYDYRNVLKAIKDIQNAYQSLSSFESVEELLQLTYLYIFEKNYRAREEKQIHEGLSALLERCYLLKKQAPKVLVTVLLELGTIKQMYLATLCLLNIQQQSLDEQLKLKIAENLQKQSQSNVKYFSELFEGIDQSDLPHLSFRKMQLLTWAAFIKQKLNLPKP